MPVIWATSAGAPARSKSGLWAGLLSGISLARPFAQGERGEIEETGGAQFLQTRQLVQAIEAKMDEKARSGHPKERPAGACAPALGADPSSLHQAINGPLAEGNPSDLLDFGARHRLMVGNHR